MTQNAQIAVRLPDELAGQLRALAQQENVKPSVIVRRALRQLLSCGPAATAADRDAVDRVRIELQAIGRNLNQLVRDANRAALGQGRGPTPEDLEQSIAAINEAVRLAYQLLTRWAD